MFNKINVMKKKKKLEPDNDFKPSYPEDPIKVAMADLKALLGQVKFLQSELGVIGDGVADVIKVLYESERLKSHKHDPVADYGSEIIYCKHCGEKIN